MPQKYGKIPTSKGPKHQGVDASPAPADEMCPSVNPDTNIFELDTGSHKIRHKKAKRDLEAKGFFLLPEFFRWKAKGMGQQDNAEAVQTLEQEEEEEEEAAETLWSAHNNLSNLENGLGSCWGASWTILYESEESSSDETPSDIKDPQSAATWELDCLCCRNTLNEIATQPRNNTMETLQNHAKLQVRQAELALVVRHKPLDKVLYGHTVAMVTHGQRHRKSSQRLKDMVKLMQGRSRTADSPPPQITADCVGQRRYHPQTETRPQ
ncbi:hypothetical protein EDB86DRAFT_2835087 [Lactarius hatsudake]|nr:hypothetical protein EDB86DRAFT_2835087 [Lactarius hatsudake]